MQRRDSETKDTMSVYAFPRILPTGSNRKGINEKDKD
jgi:hypothetical protein